MPKCQTVIHDLTRFNHQCSLLLRSSAYARLRSYWSLHPVAFNFLIPIIFSPAHLGSSTFYPFFIGYGHSHLQRLLFLVYLDNRRLSKEIHLPAYLNNIMVSIKLLHALALAGTAALMCREDWLPPTYKVLRHVLINGFMLVTYCFLISTAKVCHSARLGRQLPRY